MSASSTSAPRTDLQLEAAIARQRAELAHRERRPRVVEPVAGGLLLVTARQDRRPR